MAQPNSVARLTEISAPLSSTSPRMAICCAASGNARCRTAASLHGAEPIVSQMLQTFANSGGSGEIRKCAGRTGFVRALRMASGELAEAIEVRAPAVKIMRSGALMSEQERPRLSAVEDFG